MEKQHVNTVTTVDMLKERNVFLVVMLNIVHFVLQQTKQDVINVNMDIGKLMVVVINIHKIVEVFINKMQHVVDVQMDLVSMINQNVLLAQQVVNHVKIVLSVIYVYHQWLIKMENVSQLLKIVKHMIKTLENVHNVKMELH